MRAKYLIWLSLLALLTLYAVLVSLFGFEGPIALTIHFTRIAVTVAALVMYFQMIGNLFEGIPPPRRDYLVGSIIFYLLSAVYFSNLNEAGRVFGVDPSVFTSPIAGIGSLLLITAAGFSLIAPDMLDQKTKKKTKTRVIAIGIGLIVSVCLVIIAPFFRIPNQ